MAYAILRTSKLKSFGEIGGSLSHTFRTRETPNADQARAHLNENSGPETPEAIQQAIKDRLPEKRRSDAVLCIEYLITASPEHFQRDDGRQYFEDAKRWLEERHGAENVVSTHVHRDETTPHLVAYVVPLKDGKLNAKHFLGGKVALREMQTEFAQQVGLKHGLERGIEGSKANHQTIQEYYQRANRGDVAAAYIPLPTEKQSKGFLAKESDAEFAERVADQVKQELAPSVAKAQEATALKKRLKEVEATNRKLVKEKLMAGIEADEKVRQANAQANKIIAQERSQAQALVAEANKSAAPWHQLLQSVPESERAGVFEAVKSAVQEIAKRVQERVVGIFQSWGRDPEQPHWEDLARVTVNEDKPNARTFYLTPAASDALREQGVRFRDKIEATPYGAKIVARRHEHERVAGHVQSRDTGRGGMSR